MSESATVNCFAGAGIETEWDSPVAPAYYFNWLTPGESLSSHREYAFNETMDGQIQSREPSLDLTYWDGSLTGELTYDGHEILLRALMGAVGESDPVGGGEDPVVWTFSPSVGPIGTSIYMNRDAKLYKYSGGKCTGATFTFGGGPVCMVSYDFLGGTMASDTVEVRADKTFYTYNPVKRVNASSSITLGSTPAEIKAYLTQATINVSNERTKESTIFASTIIEPQFSGKQKITGSMTGWMSADAYTNIGADFEGGEDSGIVITLAGAGDLEYVFTMESCYLGPTGDPQASSGGLVQCTWPFWAWYDGTNDGLTIKVTHDTATDYFA